MLQKKSNGSSTNYLKIVSDMKNECQLLSLAHRLAHDFWQRIHYSLGLPSACLAAIVGISTIPPTEIFKIFIIIITFFIAILSSLITFLNPSRKASLHLDAKKNYDIFEFMIKRFIHVHIDRDIAEEKFEMISTKHIRLKVISPLIPNRFLKKAKKRIERRMYGYKPLSKDEEVKLRFYLEREIIPNKTDIIIDQQEKWIWDFMEPETQLLTI